MLIFQSQTLNLSTFEQVIRDPVQGLEMFLAYFLNAIKPVLRICLDKVFGLAKTFSVKVAPIQKAHRLNSDLENLC